VTITIIYVSVTRTWLAKPIASDYDSTIYIGPLQRNRPTGKGRAQPYPSPLPRGLPQLSRASSTSPTPGPSNRPLGYLIPPDFDLSDSEPENLAPAIAALDLEPQSDSSSGSDLLPTRPHPAPRITVMQPARRKGAADVWTFYEDKDRRKCCAFCLWVLSLFLSAGY
jgi:hypothetical protein